MNWSLLCYVVGGFIVLSAGLGFVGEWLMRNYLKDLPDDVQ